MAPTALANAGIHSFEVAGSSSTTLYTPGAPDSTNATHTFAASSMLMNDLIPLAGAGDGVLPRAHLPADPAGARVPGARTVERPVAHDDAVEEARLHQGLLRVLEGLDYFPDGYRRGDPQWIPFVLDRRPAVVPERDAVAEMSAEAPDSRLGGGSDDQVRLEMLAAIRGSAANWLVRWWYDRRDVPREDLVAAAMDALWLGLQTLRAGERWS